MPTIPRAIRWPFYLASVESLIGWATFAVFVSLLPSFLIRTLNVHNLLVGTFIVIALQIGEVTASFVGRSMRDRVTIVTAMLALGAGTWLLLIVVPYHQFAFIALAALIVGGGGGLSYLAGVNIVNSIASPDHRAELLSAFLVACNLGLSVPTLGVGIAANFVGLYNSIIGAAVLLGIIATVTMLLMIEHKPVDSSRFASRTAEGFLPASRQDLEGMHAPPWMPQPRRSQTGRKQRRRKKLACS